MSTDPGAEHGYTAEDTTPLEIIWGDGFMSPGGAEEVRRILGGNSLQGCSVLDIGSGVGGIDLLLVREYKAASVLGIDVEPSLVEIASARAKEAGLARTLTYQLIEPGPLPVPDESFDVVFSKDAILHVADKERLLSEVNRVLRPGGRLLVSDWLRGEGAHHDAQVQEFVSAAEHDFRMCSLQEMGQLARDAGLTGVELEDRRDWYLEEARMELAGLQGSVGEDYEGAWGEEQANEEREFWKVLVTSLEMGALRPGHIRAMKPLR
jgi:phosphoethanolamine N-methyltransferase